VNTSKASATNHNNNIHSNSFTAGLRPQKSFSTNRLETLNRPREVVTEINLRNNSVRHRLRDNDRLKINDDLEQCNGNLANLRATLREKKKKDPIQENKKLEDLEESLINMKTQLENVMSTYTKKYLKRSTMSSFDESNTFREATNELLQNLSLPIMRNAEMTITTSEEESSIQPIGNISSLEENINHFALEIESYFPKEPIIEVYSQLEKTTQNLEYLEQKTNFESQKIDNFNITIEKFNEMENEKNILNEEFKKTERELKNKIAAFENKMKAKDSTIESLSLSIKELMQELEKSENLRKKLHNYIQELRGNIRVYCRVKPLLNNVKNILN
jgi:kinesin family protein C1